MQHQIAATYNATLMQRKRSCFGSYYYHHQLHVDHECHKARLRFENHSSDKEKHTIKISFATTSFMCRVPHLSDQQFADNRHAKFHHSLQTFRHHV